jgi:hypothetical protein
MRVRVSRVTRGCTNDYIARLNGIDFAFNIGQDPITIDIPEPAARLVRTIVYEGHRGLIEKQMERGYLNPGQNQPGYGGISITERNRVWEE